MNFSLQDKPCSNRMADSWFPTAVISHFYSAVYEDDASRFVTGYGVFEHATTENALAVLEEAIRNHGKPASIMTDRGSQFYASASEAKKKGGVGI